MKPEGEVRAALNAFVKGDLTCAGLIAWLDREPRGGEAKRLENIIRARLRLLAKAGFTVEQCRENLRPLILGDLAHPLPEVQNKIDPTYTREDFDRAIGKPKAP